ncbi:F-box domain [Arabidopsis thaliana x Arabidopsis arenosa]|uniref:F-box domain n=1 Tax=Arabidopsis thaliana x Arabidopsis arenosa TaxID=1240361 RepID=A0A8T2AC09_9BRAS|nr:F-box domain [Arabidopsis thaliana x Arabidopsis arenosa]
MELSRDLVEHILHTLPVKSLVRFKSVSPQWKSIIESRYFKQKHLLCRESQDPDILIINPIEFDEISKREKEENVTRMFTLGSIDVIKLPNLCPLRKPIYLERNKTLLYYPISISGSCDGMICYFNHYNLINVVNPITRWSRSVPQARFQVDVLDMRNRDSWKGEKYISLWNLGFGKDKFTGTYKLVWLYNSYELGLENATTCEVFDFSTNKWRYVIAAPVRILELQKPVYLDGSLHWFTDEDIAETRVLAFDIQTEKFHIISKTPFVQQVSKKIIMCNLNNRLCVSQKEWPMQEIWSLINSDMTWEKIYTLNLETAANWFAKDLTFGFIPEIIPCVIPIAILGKKKSLMLYDAVASNPNLVIYDPELRSYDLCFVRDYRVHHQGTAVSCFSSLMSIE